MRVALGAGGGDDTLEALIVLGRDRHSSSLRGRTAQAEVSRCISNRPVSIKAVASYRNQCAIDLAEERLDIQ